jgi:hypothetical protein
MPLPIQNLHTIDTTGSYVVETDVDIQLSTAPPNTEDGVRLVRANVYRPKDSFFGGKRYPVLVTYGPCKQNQSFSLFMMQLPITFVQMEKIFHIPSKINTTNNQSVRSSTYNEQFPCTILFGAKPETSLCPLCLGDSRSRVLDITRIRNRARRRTRYRPVSRKAGHHECWHKRSFF